MTLLRRWPAPAVIRRDAGRWLLDLIYPPRCAGCGWRGEWICAACAAALPLVDQVACQRCGSPTLGDCRCANVGPLVQRARYAGPYEQWLRSAIHQLKYDGESSRAESLGALLRTPYVSLGVAGTLVPVPLHRQRQRERGFNQSLLLAEVLSRLISVPVWDGLLRIVDTPHQVGLDAAARRANVQQAFDVRAEALPVPTHAVLVDDVLTTGATTSECAAVLHRHGARWIGVLTLC